MNRADQLAEVLGRAVPRETVDRLECYEQLLLAENRRQNLIGRSTEPDIWVRHIVDCAQLLHFQLDCQAHWLDIGAGAGLPGLVLAIIGARAVTLVEPRRLRAEFLAQAIETLDLAGHVHLLAARVEAISGSFDMITARAFATPAAILALSTRLANERTIWVLPRGRGGKSELAELARTWQGEFRTVPSITDGDATILIASSPQPRKTR